MKMPVLVIDGDKKLDQTQCILRYICQKHGLYPTDPEEIMLCERVCDTVFMDLLSDRLFTEELTKTRFVDREAYLRKWLMSDEFT